MDDVAIADAKLGRVRLAPAGSGPSDAATRPEHRPGCWKARFTVPARLFEPLTDEELAWLSGETSK